MAKVQYEVIKDAGAQFPVGHVFETDSLHPSLAQHVRRLGRTVEPEPDPEKEPEKEPEKPTRKDPVKKVDKTPDPDDDNT